jgi:hypothetical protein
VPGRGVWIASGALTRVSTIKLPELVSSEPEDCAEPSVEFACRTYVGVVDWPLDNDDSSELAIEAMVDVVRTLIWFRFAGAGLGACESVEELAGVVVGSSEEVPLP